MRQSLYRIIDVNFNRAREAARVMEEFARFVLNSQPLSARVKALRHRLSSVIDSLDQTQLIMSRNSRSDVGAGLKVEGQMSRGNVRDVFTAAAKRLPEALRVLAETIQTIDLQSAAEIETLRFEAYSLEKDIFLRLENRLRYSAVRLYVLLDNTLGGRFEHTAMQCIKGGADCLQLRCKNIDDGQRYALAQKLVKMCRDNGVLSIINDSADIAIASGADGLHLGQDDMPVDAARNLYPRPLITGLSTHDPQQLREAIELNVDYVGIGPAFTTTTKPGIQVAGMDYVREAVRMLADTGIGHAVIGGINLGNIAEVIAAGAKTVAVCSAVTSSDDQAQVCRKFKELLTAASDAEQTHS